MHIDEADIGDYRVYAAAAEVPERGYIAALVVKRVRGPGPAREIHREESLAGGYAWPTATQALAFAMRAGEQVVLSPLLGMWG